MRNRILAFFGLVLLLNQAELHSQISMSVGYRQTTMSSNSQVPISVSDPTIIGFSTVEFSNMFPKANIPSEEIKVNFPDMSGTLDTVGILWYLKPENYSAKGEVNIIIVGINPDSSKTYYIDNNNDRTFAENEGKFTFKPDEQKRTLEIKILGAYYNYTLLNPDYIFPEVSPSRIKEYYSKWHQSQKKPSINVDFSMMTGGGTAKLNYSPTESFITSYLYQAKIFGSFRPAVGLDLSWFGFHVLLSGSFERLQYDETITYIYSDKVRTRNYNSGIWMTSKLHGGVTAEYDFGIFKKLWVSPFASYYVYKVTNGKKFDKSIDSPTDAKYKDMYSNEFGVKLKLPTTARTLLYVKLSYLTSWFDATEYLHQSIPGTYSVDYNQTYFGFGIQHRLFRN